MMKNRMEVITLIFVFHQIKMCACVGIGNGVNNGSSFCYFFATLGHMLRVLAKENVTPKIHG